jgi:hypothetical protein
LSEGAREPPAEQVGRAIGVAGLKKSAGDQRERDFGLGELHIEVRARMLRSKSGSKPLGLDELDAVIAPKWRRL